MKTNHVSNLEIPAGIDDLSLYVPEIYLPVAELAAHRHLDYEKLNKGLGLEAMAVADVHEDAATMAANAVKDLLEKNGIAPQSIGRIYVGSESATDGSKPIASYVLGMLADYYKKNYSANAFLNTDAVDMTFACIAGVDALLNTLDWVRADHTRTGIVVCTDNAKYELGSSGEYTQGAGAVALLIKSNPRLLSIDEPVGVATVSEHDFFKPLRRVSRQRLAEAVKGNLPNGTVNFSIPGILSPQENYLEVYKIFPVFDGPYSNECYASRLKAAYTHFSRLKANHRLHDWDRIVFHLPYAFHGRRIFPEIFYDENSRHPGLKEQMLKIDPQFDENKLMKTVAQTRMYKEFVKEKIEKGQRASALVGNIYTGSLFLSLMSLLETELAEGHAPENLTIGFCSYGSGSKSKVFQGRLQSGWKKIAGRFKLFQTLAERKAIDFETYEELHRGNLKKSISAPKNEFFLKEVSESPNLYGKRIYGYAQKAKAAYPMFCI